MAAIARVTLIIEDIEDDPEFLAETATTLGLTNPPLTALLQAMWEHDPVGFVANFMPDIEKVEVT